MKKALGIEKWPGSAGAGLTETVILMGLLAIGTIGVLSIFGEDVRGVGSVIGDSLAAAKQAEARTRPADVELHKNLANFAHNNPSGRNLLSSSDLAAMRAALKMDSEKQHHARHLASVMPESELDPRYLRKTALSGLELATIGPGGGMTAGALGAETVAASTAGTTFFGLTAAAAWLHLSYYVDDVIEDAGVALYRAMGIGMPTRQERREMFFQAADPAAKPLGWEDQLVMREDGQDEETEKGPDSDEEEGGSTEDPASEAELEKEEDEAAKFALEILGYSLAAGLLISFL